MKRIAKKELEIIKESIETKQALVALQEASNSIGAKMSKIAQTISKKFGERSMLYLREHPDYAKVKNWVSTQNCAIDWICSGKSDGTGGLPVGRIIELFGDPSSGKSLLLAHILAEVQRRGGIPVLYDVENAFDMYFAKRIGLDVDNLLYTKAYTDAERDKMIMGEDGKLRKGRIHVRVPATVEKMTSMVEELIDITYHEYPDILLAIGLDSVAGLSTEHELNEPDKKDFTKAQGIRTFVKKLEGKIADRNCIFIATNHVIANINIENIWEKKDYKKHTPKEDKSQPGGSGLPFGSSVRLDLLRGYDIKENKILTIGHQIFAYAQKNKVFIPHRRCEVEMYFDSGLDKYSGFLDILIAKGAVEEMGDQVFRFAGQRFKRKPQERPKFIGFTEVVEMHPEILSLANEA